MWLDKKVSKAQKLSTDCQKSHTAVNVSTEASNRRMGEVSDTRSEHPRMELASRLLPVLDWSLHA